MRVLGKDFKRRGQQLYTPSQGADEDKKTAVPLSALSLDTVIAYLVRMHHTGAGDTDSLRWRQTAKIANERTEKLEKEIEKLEAGKQNTARRLRAIRPNHEPRTPPRHIR